MTDATSPSALICPKCGGAMRTYERNRILVDQCTECRGVFLDRGELEQLVSAEQDYYQPPPPAAPGDTEPDRYRRERRDEVRDDQPKRRRGSFLGDLLDFG